MEHDEATRSHAAERYVAHELSPAERDAFEEHFFDCRQCADDVRFELTFTANVRAVSRAQWAAPRAGFWETWRDRLRLRPVLTFSVAANFVLAAGLGCVLLTATHDPAAPGFTQPYFCAGSHQERCGCACHPSRRRSLPGEFPYSQWGKPVLSLRDSKCRRPA
jgi:hypothetical protein